MFKPNKGKSNPFSTEKSLAMTPMGDMGGARKKKQNAGLKDFGSKKSSPGLGSKFMNAFGKK